MNRFFVVWERITISCPSLHSGHSTSPSTAMLVPSMVNFFFLAEYDRYPFASKHCASSFLRMLIFFSVTRMEWRWASLIAVCLRAWTARLACLGIRYRAERLSYKRSCGSQYRQSKINCSLVLSVTCCAQAVFSLSGKTATADILCRCLFLFSC